MKWKVGVDYPEWGDNEYYLNTMSSGYLMLDETPKQGYQRIVNSAIKHLQGKWSNEEKEILREEFFKMLWNGWLIPSTPVMVNCGTEKGLPISCFGGVVDDTMYDIYRKNLELAMLSKIGGGTSYDFSSVRCRGSLIKNGELGTSEGVIPFIKCYDSTVIASKQGKVRRGATAIYLDIEHGDYKEFLDIRQTKGAIERQCHAIHQGAIISDNFMNKVKSGDKDARELWLNTIKTRIKTGEPYMFFIDNANNQAPWSNKNIRINHSNLCSEIMLPNSPNDTFVCCLSSLNVYKFDEWYNYSGKYSIPFLATIFLDCIIEEFIEKGSDIKGISDAISFSKKTRALGLGALGYASYLQSKMIPFISIQANAINNKVFKFIREEAEKASKLMLKLNDNQEPEWCAGTGRWNLTLMAIAPNRSSSKLSGGVSQGVEPIAANIYTDNDAKGKYIKINQDLKNLLIRKGYTDDQIDDICNSINNPTNMGSIQALSIFTDHEKEVFKTFKEINQLELVRQACHRQKYIDQGQSINLAFSKDAPAKFINQVHLEAWEGGLKSLYYFRSEAPIGGDSLVKDLYSECVMCEG